jgi:hypothetical protein
LVMISTGISLKAYSIEMAGYLGLSPLAVYERQRALARLGVLPTIEGRGPKSGVRATPESVAPLLVAALYADSLSDIDNRLLRLLNAKPAEMEQRLVDHEMRRAHVESPTPQLRALRNKALAPAAQTPFRINCPITGGANFREAVQLLLASETLAAKVSSIAVNRSMMVGVISARDDRLSQFGMRKKGQKPQLIVEARFPGELVVHIASDLVVLASVKEYSSPKGRSRKRDCDQ